MNYVMDKFNLITYLFIMYLGVGESG